MAAKPGLGSEETRTRVDKELKLTDQRLALNTLQLHHYPQSQSRPLPASMYTAISSSAAIFLGQADLGGYFHSIPWRSQTALGSG